MAKLFNAAIRRDDCIYLKTYTLVASALNSGKFL